MPKRSTTPLAVWLRAQMQEHGLTQTALAVRAGVAAGTVNAILKQNHVPKIKTLFQLADALETSRLDILLVFGILRRAGTLPGAPEPRNDQADESHFEWRLNEEFRRVPPQTARPTRTTGAPRLLTPRGPRDTVQGSSISIPARLCHTHGRGPA